MRKQAIHPRARTTPEIRKEIQESKESISALARKYSITRHTVRKWKTRNTSNDSSHAPKQHGKQKLTESDIQLIIKTREATKLPLDDLLEVLLPQLSYPIKRAQLSNILKKHGLTLPERKEKKPKGKFKDYGVGFVHIDCTYLPKLENVQKKVFCAIERTTKWAYIEIHERKTKEASEAFLSNLIKACPFKIHTILTDNGSEFTYKLLPVNKQTKKEHPFDEVCNINNIKHKLTKYRHPWTNGQVERFNRQLKSGTIKVCRYETQLQMEEAIKKWILWYNDECKLKSLKRISPNQAVEKFLLKSKEFTCLLPS